MGKATGPRRRTESTAAVGDPERDASNKETEINSVRGHQDGVKHAQLFNLKENPHEFIREHHDPKVAAMTGVKPTKNQLNLAKDPKYAEKLKEMEGLLLSEMYTDIPTAFGTSLTTGSRCRSLKRGLRSRNSPQT